MTVYPAFLAALVLTLNHADPVDWLAVPAATLDNMRGGFTTAAGLELSLGIERLVSINGAVVARTSLHVSDIANLDGAGAQSGASLSAIKLIQTGGANMVHAALPQQAPGAMVIQNSLDGQRIESHTTITASANSLGMLKTLNFHTSLGDALARSATIP